MNLQCIMSNTVITNYTDLNGPSAKADSSVVVIVNKDGTLSVDQNLLDTLMGTDGSQSAISLVRVGHEGKPDDATDSENEDDKIPHVTLSVDSYYDEPNSIIKYDSGAEMLQSLRIETRENSLVGFQNDHCYTSLLMSPSQSLPQKSDNPPSYDEPMLEITHNPPPKPSPIPNSKKITIIDQKIIPKGKKILLNASSEPPIIFKGNDVLCKPLSIISKPKEPKKVIQSENVHRDDSVDTSSTSSSGESIPDRDSDSDYKETKERSGSIKVKKNKVKPRILKVVQNKQSKHEVKTQSKLKVNKMVKADVKEKINPLPERKDTELDLESILPINKIPAGGMNDLNKNVVKITPKSVKKEKKMPAHVTALLTDMTSLFSTPDVIRRVSTDNKIPAKIDKDSTNDKKTSIVTPKVTENTEVNTKTDDSKLDTVERAKNIPTKTYSKSKDKITNNTDKSIKTFDTIPQLDEVSLTQILQGPTNVASVKNPPSIPAANVMSNPGLAGPLSPTLDLLGGLQPEEEGLTEDLLMHVAQLVESSENLQEVIDKQVLGKVDTSSPKSANSSQPSFQQAHNSNNLYMQTLSKTVQKTPVRKDPIEIVRRDGRVITLPPIEAPATRSSKRKSQIEISNNTETVGTAPSTPVGPVSPTLEPQLQAVSKQYLNKKLAIKKQESLVQPTVAEKISAESQESWNSEDDPNRLWCICKQPHNNRFMICCDSCEDWFHGKCVNITKAMGQQMEEQGIEWRCPNCIKKAKPQPKNTPLSKHLLSKRKIQNDIPTNEKQNLVSSKDALSKTGCIVCRKFARVNSIYCSDECILKHAQDSLGTQAGSKAESDTEKPPLDKQKPESRVIVYERKSGRLLAGPNAPTAENLRPWLQKNPTFEVVRPGTLSTIKPNTLNKKKLSNEPNKIQTTINFERIPRKTNEQNILVKSQQPEVKEKLVKLISLPKDETKPIAKTAPTARPPILCKTPITPKTPPVPKLNTLQLIETPKASTSSAKTISEPRKLARNSTPNRSLSVDKAPSVSPLTSSRRKDNHINRRMDSSEPIRDNVRKALQEQMSLRMAENTGPKFTEQEIQQFAEDTEVELHDLFRDVGMKYKAKYRSLMFNIKDRKNLSLWQKICDRSITPHQLVRLSPEELASQELAEWRDQEAKHQLELIKKSELDLLAASKTYVLKTHKGEEVMENKESVSTELDPTVPVEDVVIALNDSIVGEEVTKEVLLDASPNKSEVTEKKHSKKRGREDRNSDQSKKRKSERKRDSESRKSKSSRRKSGSREKETKEGRRRSTRKTDKKTNQYRSESKEKIMPDSNEKSDTVEQSQRRSSSTDISKRSRDNSRSKSKERPRLRGRSPKRSQSRDSMKSKRRSRSNHTGSIDEKVKHRSRSQENVYSKKNDSTDSDSLERPKSAMLKDVHPEYDPHEPMITSAFSEEDLRKSREDVYEESFKTDIGTSIVEYDPSKSFSIDSDVIMPSTQKNDKTSEAESDQEPSSTVENSAATIWNGCINMVDVARFYVAAHEVSGSTVDLEEDLSTELDIVGRINPDTVWDYIGKMKKASNKDIVILRLQAANDEEKMQYIALYSYLSSRNRLGVVKVSNTTSIKDLYIVPLPANSSLPAVLLPLRGPGLADAKVHLLLAIVVRQRKRRLPLAHPHPHHAHAHAHHPLPAKIARESHKPPYSTPLTAKASYTPPTSPRRRAPLPFPAYTTPALSTTVKDQIAASLAAADLDEAYSPGSSDDSGSAHGCGLLRVRFSTSVYKRIANTSRPWIVSVYRW